MYKSFGKKKHWHGVSDAGTRLLFKFRSGTRGFNVGTDVEKECTLCGVECESVVHVLWECLVYSSRASFMVKLKELLGYKHVDFEVLNSIEKTS